MTRFLPRSLSALATASAAVTLFASATAVPAAPAKGGAYYAATLTSPTAKKTLIVRDSLWKCAGDRCTSAAAPTSRASTVCEALAKQTGPVTDFRAGSDSFDESALAKCNGKR